MVMTMKTYAGKGSAGSGGNAGVELGELHEVTLLLQKVEREKWPQLGARREGEREVLRDIMGFF